MSRPRYSGAYRRMTPTQRWWACVDRGAPGCWRWLGAPNKSGYGAMKIAGRTILAHRFGYELLVGDIPAGLGLDHLCRNRRCVNPGHLEAVDDRTNILRGVSVVATHATKTVCPNGHRYDYVERGPYGLRRRCRRCRNAADRQRQWRAERTTRAAVAKGETT